MTETSDRRPKASICIPSFNYGKYISQAIESVLSQSLKDFELVIVDDCSTDDSKDVISRFSDPRIRFFRNESNIGMTRNWNKCINLSRGEFICILCADDYLHPEFLERCIGSIESSPKVGMTYSAFETVNDKRETVRILRLNDADFVESGVSAFRRLAKRNVVMLSTALFRKDCFDSLGGFDEQLSYGPDMEMVARLATRFDVAYLSTALGYYRVHDENLTNAFGKKGQIVEEIIKTIDKMMSDIPEGGDLIDLREESDALKANHISGAMYIWAIYGDIRSTRKNILKVYSLDRRKILDFRLMGVFLLSFLGKGITLSFIRKFRIAR